MEPMTIGSAPSSPSSPGTNPNYLPPFLMGDNQTTTPKTSTSPELNKSYTYNLNVHEGGNLRQKLFSPLPSEPLSTHSSFDVNISKPGPPKQSLFDTIDVTKTVHTPTSNLTVRQSLLSVSPPVENNPRYIDISNANSSICRNESYINFESVKSASGQNLWITVFGFPANSASLVLARFSNCGTIVDKRFPAQGNWVHLKYSSTIEAAKALALNGKLISNCIMVGVVPHQSKLENKENMNTSSYTSPIRARSLRHSFVSPQNSNTVLLPQNVPQKSTGFVTKAMEYVFGW